MPEANVLYSVTAAVVAGLLVWVAVVLKTAKEPWARETVAPVVARGDDVPVEPEVATEKSDTGTSAAGVKAAEPAATSVPPSSSLPKVLAGSAGGAGADATAEATAVVVAQKKPPEKADADANEEAKADADAKADEDAKADPKKA